MKKLFLVLAAILLPVLSHGRAAAAFIQADGTIASPYAFIPKLSQEKKDELLKRYVSGMVGKDYNLQWAPVTGWRDFNQYVCRTATLFDENDRKRIIAEVGLRLPGVYFKDAQISLHSGVYSVADMATGKEIDTAVSLPKPMMIDASDLWTVLYHYLEALKPANGEYSYPPVSYRYLKLNEKRLRLIISRVRPDLKPGSIEIEDAVSFVTRKGFLSGNVRLLRAEFEKNLELGRYLNSLRDGKAPNLGPGANMARFAKAAGPALKNLALNQEGWSRLNVYLAYWGVVASLEGEPLFSVSREEGLSPVLAEQAEAASATASSFAAVVSSSIHPGGSEGAYREAQRPGMNAPHTAASVVSGLMSDAKVRVLSWFGKKPAKPAAQQPETETAQDKVLDDFILPEDVRVRQEPEEGEQVYQGTAAVVVAPSTSTESMAASDDSDFYGGLKSDLLSSRSRQPVAKIQDYELQIPLLADGVVYPGYEQLLFAANAALAKNPKSPKAMLMRSDANYGLKRYTDSLRDAESSLRIQKDLHAYELAAWSLFKLGQDEKAYSATVAGLNLNPENTELLMVAVRASERLGHYRAMLEDLEKAAEVNSEQFGKLFENAYAEYEDAAPDFQPTLMQNLKSSRKNFKKTFRKRFSDMLPALGVVLLVFFISVAVYSGARKKSDDEFEEIEGDEAPPDPVTEPLVAGRYKSEELLYHDPGGTVFKGIDLASECPIVINKFMSELPRDRKRSLLKEKNRLLSLNHPNIGLTYEILESKENFYVITDYVGGINLEEKLSKEPFIMSFSEGRKMCMDILRALEYLHSKKVIYGVLRPTDIQINQEGIARLINVGIGSVIDRDNNRWISYIAPEALTGRYTEKSDLYALGVCFYRAVTGVVPDTSGLDPHAKPASKMVPTLPPSIDRFFDDTLSSEPLRRPDSAADFQTKLENL